MRSELSPSFQLAVSALAARIAPPARGIVDLHQLSGGATQEIWSFALDEAGGGAPLILRRAPGGGEMHDKGVGLEVEARLLEAAGAAGVPVPAVRYVLDESDGLGQGFVMDFVAGETLGGRIVKSQALASARPLLARQCGAILADIHRIDPGKFPSLDRLSPADLVAQWEAAYRQADWPRPVFEWRCAGCASAAPHPPPLPVWCTATSATAI